MQKESLKFENSSILEGMTSLRALIAARESGINDRPIHAVYYDVQRRDKIAKELAYLGHVSERFDNFPILPLTEEELAQKTLGNSHGGIIAECGKRNLPQLKRQISTISPGFYAMIQGIEDPYNFGYALRSLYACGADGIILSERNWMSAAGVVARASAGASERFPIYIADPLDAVDFFHGIEHTVVCADERTENLLHKTPMKKPILLIVGGERRGISRALLERADTLVKIPYARPFAASLSAASAATIMAYEIARQNGFATEADKA